MFNLHIAEAVAEDRAREIREAVRRRRLLDCVLEGKGAGRQPVISMPTVTASSATVHRGLLRTALDRLRRGRLAAGPARQG